MQPDLNPFFVFVIHWWLKLSLVIKRDAIIEGYQIKQKFNIVKTYLEYLQLRQAYSSSVQIFINFAQ